jgi:hypothetical protein
MRSFFSTPSPASNVAREQSYQDYLRISQIARAQAQRARTQAVTAFWRSVGQAMRHVVSQIRSHVYQA